MYDGQTLEESQGMILLTSQRHWLKIAVVPGNEWMQISQHFNMFVV